MSGHVLVLGGARSGKTGFAERMTMRIGSKPLYLATAQALDDEMRDRIRLHQRDRHRSFATLEEPIDLVGALKVAALKHDAILVDCLTLWISNLLGIGQDVAAAVDSLVAALPTIETARIVLVSNEVGLGIVPDNALSRRFRDEAGFLHQAVAAAAAEVHLMVAGLSIRAK